MQPPVWDIPARMITVAALVLALTAAAPFLGPRLAGLLAPFPLFASTLAAFAQHEYGPAAGRSVIMGLVLGLWGFAGFFLTVTATAKSAGIVAAVVIAAVVALAIQGATLWAISQNTPLPM